MALPQTKLVPMRGFTNDTVATNTTTWCWVDTIDYDWVTIDLLAGTAAVTSTPLGINIYEADTTTTVTTYPVLRSGTEFTASVQASTGTNLSKFNIDLRGRKRYIFLNYTPADAAQSFVAVANLGRAGEAPVSAAKATGVHESIEGTATTMDKVVAFAEA